MKLCAVCNNIVRNPTFCANFGFNKVVLCEKDKNADYETIRQNMTAELPNKPGIESWDYLWQGHGQT